MMDVNPLLGKTITRIELTTDHKAIRFIVAEDVDPILARVSGDCCSETWIEHLSLPARGFPALVLAAQDIIMPDLGDHTGDHDCEDCNGIYRCIEYYGFEIKTNRGDVVIDYRNSSNGYYGGNLRWNDDYNEEYDGGVWGGNIPNYEWEPVIDDV